MPENQNNIKSSPAETKTIFNCWSEAIKRFFDIKGRTTRYEFWAFQTVSLFIFILAALFGFILGSYKIIFEIYALYFLAPATTVSVRRLHDIGLSGWWTVPALAFAIIMLVCWEMNTDFVVLPVFLLLSYMSYLYYILGEDGCLQDNAYGVKVYEPQIYNQDSKVFIIFMVTFLSVLWIIFLARVLL